MDEGSWKARLFELFLSYLRALTREYVAKYRFITRAGVVVISKRVKYNRGSNPLSKCGTGVTVFRVPSVLGSGKSWRLKPLSSLPAFLFFRHSRFNPRVNNRVYNVNWDGSGEGSEREELSRKLPGIG